MGEKPGRWEPFHSAFFIYHKVLLFKLNILPDLFQNRVDGVRRGMFFLPRHGRQHPLPQGRPCSTWAKGMYPRPARPPFQHCFCNRARSHFRSTGYSRAAGLYPQADGRRHMKQPGETGILRKGDARAKQEAARRVPRRQRVTPHREGAVTQHDDHANE